MVVMWKIERGDAKIHRIECTRVTDKSVWFMEKPFYVFGGDRDPVERKAARIGDRVSYHATWEEARANLMEHAELHLQSARSRLETARGYHGNVKGLRKPAEVEAGAA